MTFRKAVTVTILHIIKFGSDGCYELAAMIAV
jgi:hypothetical protein